MEVLTKKTGPLVLSATVAASLVGGAWWSDAWRRERHTARLHRTMVDLLLNALTAGDAVTARHSRRVAHLADAVARRYGFTRDEHATLRVAALLHDMGKIDDRVFHIVHSCDPLTHEERDEIQRHPNHSAEILRPLEEIHPGITEIVESHHECWDGEGYPAGLAGEEIPLRARIISVADVFDALTQPRTYHDPMPVPEAMERIRSNAGSRFDPGVVATIEEPGVRKRWEEIAARGRREEAAATGASAR